MNTFFKANPPHSVKKYNPYINGYGFIRVINLPKECYEKIKDPDSYLQSLFSAIYLPEIYKTHHSPMKCVFLELEDLPIYNIIEKWALKGNNTGTDLCYYTTKPDGKTLQFCCMFKDINPIGSISNQYGFSSLTPDKTFVQIKFDFNEMITNTDDLKCEVKEYIKEYWSNWESEIDRERESTKAQVSKEDLDPISPEKLRRSNTKVLPPESTSNNITLNINVENMNIDLSKLADLLKP